MVLNRYTGVAAFHEEYAAALFMEIEKAGKACTIGLVHRLANKPAHRLRSDARDLLMEQNDVYI